MAVGAALIALVGCTGTEADGDAGPPVTVPVTSGTSAVTTAGPSVQPPLGQPVGCDAPELAAVLEAAPAAVVPTPTVSIEAQPDVSQVVHDEETGFVAFGDDVTEVLTSPQGVLWSSASTNGLPAAGRLWSITGSGNPHVALFEDRDERGEPRFSVASSSDLISWTLAPLPEPTAPDLTRVPRHLFSSDGRAIVIARETGGSPTEEQVVITGPPDGPFTAVVGGRFRGMNEIAAIDQTLVAFGGRQLWFKSSGDDWRTAVPRSGSAIRLTSDDRTAIAVLDTTANRPRVGRRAEFPGPTRHDLFSTSDGEDWVPVPFETAPRYGLATDLTAGPAGFVISATAFVDDPQPDVRAFDALGCTVRISDTSHGEIWSVWTESGIIVHEFNVRDLGTGDEPTRGRGWALPDETIIYVPGTDTVLLRLSQDAIAEAEPVDIALPERQTRLFVSSDGVQWREIITDLEGLHFAEVLAVGDDEVLLWSRDASYILRQWSHLEPVPPEPQWIRVPLD